MKDELFQFSGSSRKKGLHMLFICLGFPVVAWAMIRFVGDGAFEQDKVYIYAGTGVLCFFAFLIGVLPHVVKNRVVRIAIDEQRISVSFTDDCDYELSLAEIREIKIHTHAQRTTMKDYFLVDESGESRRLPHYYYVPIDKVIKLLMKLNPDIQRTGQVRT